MSRTKANQKPTVGVVGAGSFGLTVAQLLAISNNVLLFARDPKVVEEINETRTLLGVTISPKITAVSSYNNVAELCEVIFPVVPSDDFRNMMKDLGPLLTPRHILIHGTKGLDASRIK